MLTPLAQGDPEGQARDMAFRQGLEKLGWTVGSNIQIDYRWGIDNIEKANAAAEELLGRAPDVILASTSRVIATLQQATHTVPIVYRRRSPLRYYRFPPARVFSRTDRGRQYPA